MSHSLQFQVRHRYSLRDPGISVPVRLAVGGRSVDLFANLDTGASFCIFHRALGEALGLSVESGFRQKLVTAAGWFWAFGHQVTLDVLGLGFDTTVYFAAPADFPRNVLGRQGWLNRVRLAVIDYDGTLYLSPYED